MNLNYNPWKIKFSSSSSSSSSFCLSLTLHSSCTEPFSPLSPSLSISLSVSFCLPPSLRLSPSFCLPLFSLFVCQSLTLRSCTGPFSPLCSCLPLPLSVSVSLPLPRTVSFAKLDHQTHSAFRSSLKSYLFKLSIDSACVSVCVCVCVCVWCGVVWCV